MKTGIIDSNENSGTVGEALGVVLVESGEDDGSCGSCVGSEELPGLTAIVDEGEGETLVVSKTSVLSSMSEDVAPDSADGPTKT